MALPRVSFGLISLLLVGGAVLSAQEEAPENRYKAYYKKFTTGGVERIMNAAEGRLEWFRQRMGGDLSPEFMQHMAKEAHRQREANPMRFSARGNRAALNPEGAWRSIGPDRANVTVNGTTTLNKVDAGRLRRILVDKTDASGNTVYVLAAGGGLWKTTSFTAPTPEWTPLTDFVGSTAGGSVAFGRDSQTLYLGMGDAWDPNVGGFMVKSVDGGLTWSSPAGLGESKRVYEIQVDTTQGQDIVFVGTDKGFFRSTDGGESFEPVQAFDKHEIWNLVRTSAGWLMTAIAPGAKKTETTPPRPEVTTFYLSNDQGTTWSKVVGTPNGMGRVTFGIGEPGDADVYAFAATTYDTQQLDCFRSRDGGLTWTALGLGGKTPANPTDYQKNMDVMAGQPFYNHMVLVDPTDPKRDTLYLGGQFSNVKSIDGGQTWRNISEWLGRRGLAYVHADMHCSAFSNFDGKPCVYIGTDGGLFISYDGGKTFDDSKNVGQSNHLIYALSSNPESPASTVIGLQDNGTRVRVGESSTFDQPCGGDGFGVAWSQKSNAVAMGSYVYSSIRYATGPKNDRWGYFTNGIIEKTGAAGSEKDNNFVTSLYAAPATADLTGNTFFHATKVRLYRTTNAGDLARKWVPIGQAGENGLPSGTIIRSVSHPVGCSPYSRDRVAMVGPSDQIFYTHDGGESWEAANLGTQVSKWGGNNANVVWANDSLLYACSEGSSLEDGIVRVAKSSDGGQNWVAAGSNAQGLPNLPITKLVVDPGDGSGNTVYAATWLGVYRTLDGGATWSLFGTGLPQIRVSDIYIAPDSSYIRVATWGRGVWDIKNAPLTGSITLNPKAVSLFPGQSQAFTATVTGGGNVTWMATGGTITPEGVFTAGPMAGAFKVEATSVDNPRIVESASISVVAVSPKIRIKPVSPVVAVGRTLPFTALVTNSPNTDVIWSVKEVGGGSIDEKGLYTAPLKSGTYTVVATSVQDLGVSAEKLVTVILTGDILRNGSFEELDAKATGPKDWTNKAQYYTTNVITPQDGVKSIWFMANNVNNGKTLTQDVTMPTNMTKAVLRFYSRIWSMEGTSAVKDFVEVEARDLNGNLLSNGLRLTISNMDATGMTSASGWVAHEADFSEYKGQTIRLTFRLTDNANGIASNFMVDNVRMDVTVTDEGSTPVISALAPTQGKVNSLVVITGRTLTGATGVSFNGTPAVFEVKDDQTIHATVPFGATSGPITVTTPAGSVKSDVFTVEATTEMALYSFSPQSGAPGTLVTVKGENIKLIRSVSIGSVHCSFKVINANTLEFTVPSRAVTGPIAAAGMSGYAATASDFTVIR